MALTDNLSAIGDAIREKNGTTDLIPLADMPQAILDISSGTGLAPIDNTVTFLADNEPYEIVSVKSGNAVNAPATEPTSESGTFTGWSVDENKVEFPYTPTDDTDITAIFQTVRTVRTELEVSTNTEPFASYSTKFDCTKVNTDTAICGWYINAGSTKSCAIILVGESEEAVAFYKYTDEYSTTFSFVYDEKTYFVSYVTSGNSINGNVTSNVCSPYKIPTQRYFSEEGVVASATDLLDYYFMKDEAVI